MKKTVRWVQQLLSSKGPEQDPNLKYLYLFCRRCGDWKRGMYNPEVYQPCFVVGWCPEKCLPTEHPPRPHYYHCLCGNLDVRDNYVPMPLGCTKCGDLVRPVLNPPTTYYFLCHCGQYWEKPCYGNETEQCYNCDYDVVPREEPPTLWYYLCHCGRRGTKLSYKMKPLDCTGSQCREVIEGRADEPTEFYFRCNTCHSYWINLCYYDIPQPCKGTHVEGYACPAKVWPNPEPEVLHYLCYKCWFYFRLRANPDERLLCRRQGCETMVEPTLHKPPDIYVKGGSFVPPYKKGYLYSPPGPQTCYFVCKCPSLSGNYWMEQNWEPTESQLCRSCGYDIYPIREPLKDRKHVGYFSCKCGVKWRSDETWPDVDQACDKCGRHSSALMIEPTKS